MNDDKWVERGETLRADDTLTGELIASREHGDGAPPSGNIVYTARESHPGGGAGRASQRWALVGAASLMLACSGESELDAVGSSQVEDSFAPRVEQTEIVKGVPNRGRDPAVVALRIGGDGLCTGTLIAKDVVLTARHCVAHAAATLVCPADAVQVYRPREASTIEIVLGDRVQGQDAVARGLEILTPGGVTLCDADIAAVVLDRPIRNVRPLGVRVIGPGVGERVRAVGFGRMGDRGDAGEKLLREHVEVRSVTRAEFTVGEATCQGDSGGPAIDPDTGEVVGVVSRGGPTCEGANVFNVYTRVDPFMWLVDAALARSGLSSVKPGAGDAGTDAAPSGASRGGKEKPPSDVGSACERAQDCAAGVCLRGSSSGYCSRACGSGDRCPTRFHCQKVSGASVCVQVR